MSQIQHEIDQVEVSIEHAREMVARGKQAEALSLVPAFCEIILTGYFLNEAARLAHLSSDPMASDEVRANVMRDMAGIGAFKRYLSTIVVMGHHAANEIADSEDTLEEMRLEEAEEMI